MSYIGRYEKFINLLRDQKISGPVEIHHILPKSLGGSNDKDNLIALTPRQHYIAHWMLWKIHGGKMSNAFFFMNNHKSYKKMYSRGYEKLRDESVKNLSGKNAAWYGKKFPKEMREKQSNARKLFLQKDGVLDSIRQQIKKVRPSADDYKKSSKTMSQLIWVNDGIRSYRLKPEVAEEKLSNGFMRGRLKNYIDESYRSMRQQTAKKQWSAVKLTGHTGNLIKV